MSTLSHTTLFYETVSVTTYRLVNAAEDMAASVVRILSVWAQRARSRRQLAELDLRTLNDIGLTYADAELEIGKPFWRA